MSAASNGKTILAFAAGTWRWPEVTGSTRYHLWTLAQRGWRVLYVEPPVSFAISPREWHAPDRDFYVLTPALVPPFGPRAAPHSLIGRPWRAVTAARMAANAKRWLQKLGVKPDAIWYGAPWHSSIAQHFPNVPSVFHVYDELASSPFFSSFQRKMLQRWEEELVREVSIVACSSLPQLDARKALAKQTLLLENAVPDSFFNVPKLSERTRELVDELILLPRPIAVYGGVVDHRLDGDLIFELFNSDRLGSVVFIGKFDQNTDLDLKEDMAVESKSHGFDNVPHDAYPALYAESDFLFLLHKHSPFTDAMYPEKLNEYLASGKPILSVSLPEVVRIANSDSPADGLVRFADTPAEVHNAIDGCLADTDEARAARRIALAKRHTWSTAGEILDKALGELLSPK